jgi:excisionase family DNA binding protein
MYRPRKSPEGNPRFDREEAPRLDSSRTALGVALNFGSALDRNLSLQPLKPLSVSVPTAATLLGVGTTTVWNLIATGRIEVVRIGRRTLPTMASLERLVAETAVASRQARDNTP